MIFVTWLHIANNWNCTLILILLLYAYIYYIIYNIIYILYNNKSNIKIEKHDTSIIFARLIVVKLISVVTLNYNFSFTRFLCTRYWEAHVQSIKSYTNILCKYIIGNKLW